MRTTSTLGPRRRQLLLANANGIALQVFAFGGTVSIDGFATDEGEHIVYMTAAWTTLDGREMAADIEVGSRTVSYILHGEQTDDGRTPIHDHAIGEFSIAMLPGLTVMPYRAPAPAF